MMHAVWPSTLEYESLLSINDQTGTWTAHNSILLTALAWDAPRRSERTLLQNIGCSKGSQKRHANKQEQDNNKNSKLQPNARTIR